MDNKLSLLYRKDGTQKILSSLIAILLGMVFGSILIVIVGLASSGIIDGIKLVFLGLFSTGTKNGSLTFGFNPTQFGDMMFRATSLIMTGLKGIIDGIKLVFLGLFNTGKTDAGTLTFGFNPKLFGDMLFYATPLIMTGLSVAVSQKTGLFNIGAPGQYLMGTTASLMIALSIPTSSVNPVLIWLLAFLGGMLAGALWGAIPGLLKAFLNINEVLACIMTNWISAILTSWLFDVSNFSVFTGPATSADGKPIILTGAFKNVIEGKAAYVFTTDKNHVATAKLGLDNLFPKSQVNGGILVAIVLAVLVYIMIHKTTFGYQLKACGANRHAARYAGIQDKRNIVFSMAIAGGLAGAGAALWWLSGNTEFAWKTYQSLPAVGFNGIPVALLAINNPIGVIFSGVFMAMLNVIGSRLPTQTSYNEYITNVIIAAIVYLSAFALVIRMWLAGRKKKTAAPTQGTPKAEKSAKASDQTVSDEQKGGAQA